MRVSSGQRSSGQRTSRPPAGCPACPAGQHARWCAQRDAIAPPMHAAQLAAAIEPHQHQRPPAAPGPHCDRSLLALALHCPVSPWTPRFQRPAGRPRSCRPPRCQRPHTRPPAAPPARPAAARGRTARVEQHAVRGEAARRGRAAVPQRRVARMHAKSSAPSAGSCGGRWPAGAAQRLCINRPLRGGPQLLPTFSSLGSTRLWQHSSTMNASSVTSRKPLRPAQGGGGTAAREEEAAQPGRRSKVRGGAARANRWPLAPTPPSHP